MHFYDGEMHFFDRQINFMEFKTETAIHCHYKAWKSQDIFILIVFVWKKGMS